MSDWSARAAAWLREISRTPARSLVLAVFYALAAYFAFDVVRSTWAQAHLSLLEPSSIQWLEPLFYRSALQALSGGNLYPPPSIEYIGGRYTPAVDYLNAAVLAVWGPGFPALRVVAFTMYAGLMALFFVCVRARTTSTAFAAIATAVALTLAEPLMHWFTTVNVDAAYLLPAMAGFLLLGRHSPGRTDVTAAALLFAISFLFKPQGFLFAAAGFAFVLLYERRHLLRYTIVCGLAAGVPSVWWMISSDGWFWTSLMTVTFHLNRKGDPRFLGNLLLCGSIPTLAAFAGGAMALGAAATDWRRRDTMLLCLAWIALFVIAYAGFTKNGGGRNSLYPFLLYGVLMLAIGPSLFLRDLTGTAATGARLAQLTLAILQLHLGYQMTANVRTRVEAAPSIEAAREVEYKNRREFDARVLQLLSKGPGPVYVGVRADLQHRLGLPPQGHQTPLLDATVRSGLLAFESIVGPAVLRRHYPRMLVWEYRDRSFEKLLEPYYTQTVTLTDPNLGIPVHMWEAEPRPAAQ